MSEELEKEFDKLIELEEEMEIIKNFSDDEEEYQKARERYLDQKQKIVEINSNKQK